MATCKFCNCDTLKWCKDENTDRFYLAEADDTPHKCLNKPNSMGSRLTPVYRMLDAMAGRELAAVVNYAVRCMAERCDPKPAATRQDAVRALQKSGVQSEPDKPASPGPEPDAGRDPDDLPADAPLPF